MSLQLNWNKRDNEISELKGRIKTLNEEVSYVLNYKSKFELLKTENQELLKENSNMENHIKSLETELSQQK